MTESKYKDLIGKKITITKLNDPYSHLYEGKSGTVTSTDFDCDHIERLLGTWGSIAIYPNEDEFVINPDIK